MKKITELAIIYILPLKILIEKKVTISYMISCEYFSPAKQNFSSIKNANVSYHKIDAVRAKNDVAKYFNKKDAYFRLQSESRISKLSKLSYKYI